MIMSRVDIFPENPHLTLISLLRVSSHKILKITPNPHIWIPLCHSHWICPRDAQWVAEDQCEPECIIRNLIDNTFYKKNVVVSNPHNPLLARINPTDFRDFFASCLTHSRWEPRLAAENIWWTSSPAQSLQHSSLDFKYISGLIPSCCLSGGFMNRACRCWDRGRP